MAQSPNTGLTHIEPNQSSKEVTANTAFDDLSNFVAATLSLTISGDTLLTEAQFQSAQRFALGGSPGSGFLLELPSTVSRAFIVSNSSGQDATVQVDGGSGANVVVADGAQAYLYTDGTDVTSVASGSGSGSSVSSLDDLSDVDLTTVAPSNGDILEWNGSAFVPVSGASPSNWLGLTDTPSSYSTAGFVVVVNGTGDGLDFEDPANIGGSGSASAIDDLSDVDTSTTAPSDGDVLTWNDTDGVWEPQAGGSGSGTDESVKVSSNDTTAGYLATKLVAGTNVTLTPNNDGGDETLTISASGSGSGVNELGDVGNVTVSGLANGDVLEFNGTNWANVPIPARKLYTKKHRGALVSVDNSPSYDMADILEWASPEYDTDAFWDSGSPERFTVPQGVRKVRLSASVKFESGEVTDGDPLIIQIRKNGAYFMGTGVQTVTVSYTDAGISCSTPVLEVSPGDYFDVRVNGGESGDFLMGTDQTWFAIEVVETTRLEGTSAAAQELPYKGAQVSLSAAQSVADATEAAVSWDTEDRDTDAFWASGSGSRLTVPDGVTKVTLRAALDWGSSATGQREVRIKKNGALIYTKADNPASSGSTTQHFVTPVLDVASGDYFEVFAYQDSGSAVDVLATDDSYFALDVVETADAAAPPFDLGVFISGLPGGLEMVYQFVATRPLDFPAGLTDSQGYAATAPADATKEFDVQKNGSSVGTVSFAQSSQTATFTAASAFSLAAGDRLSIIAPASQDSALADISITLAGTR
jgi:hypothetical protein